MKEQWTRWEPMADLAEKYYIDSVLDDIEGFRVLLSESSDEKKRLLVTFKDSVYSFIRTDETFRYKQIVQLGEKHGDHFYGKWTFFRVANSPYLQWLSDQSYQISDERSLTHFCIMAVDSVLDIVVNYEPKVELIHTP